ncbi:hypothetical protein G7Z17_g6785 [Cylindrodendrum hubeiense]|uniref:Uncharacterized protein n=1 Tax=Cylindrodendrum hubeiense TaxID=595255 RepID=A0A9P5LEU1_9HYPO|nr:hypothetical protein G7Z17_g6785 [Cylindrodendrum hubeiense]
MSPSLHLWAALASTAAASLIQASDVTHIVPRNPLTGDDLALSPLSLKYGLTPRELRRDSSSGLVTRGLFDPSSFSFSIVNDYVFDIPLPLDDGSEIDFSLFCVDCEAYSTISPSFEAASILNYLDSVVNITFSDTSIHFDLDFLVEGDGTYTYNIWSSNGATGIDVDFFSIGLLIYVDLVVDVSDAIDVHGGFEYTIPDGSFLSLDLTGDILDKNFDGATFVDIPWTLQSGSATITAALRLRAELGAKIEIDIIDLGAEIEVGVYLNIPEIILQFDATETCGLETTEWLDINAGVYAQAGILSDGTLLGEAPVASSTFYSLALGTQCWQSISTTALVETTSAIEVIAETSVIPTFMVSGADPITSTITPIVMVSGADPITREATSTITPIVMVTGAPPIDASTIDAVTTSVQQSTTSYSKIRKPSTLSVKYGNSTTDLSGMHTSTVYSTKIYTVTSCAASVINCPASWRQEIVVTKEVEVYTTVCPVTEIQTIPVIATTSRVSKKLTITDGTTAPACPTPIVNTFVPPADRSPPAEKTTTIFVHVPLTKVVTRTATATASCSAASSVEATVYSTTVPEAVTEATKPAFTQARNTTATPSQVYEVPVSAATQKSFTTLIGSAMIIIACLFVL